MLKIVITILITIFFIYLHYHNLAVKQNKVGDSERRIKGRMNQVGLMVAVLKTVGR